MKKFLFVLLLCPVMLAAQQKSFTIDGKLEGYPDNTEVKLFENNGQTPLATAKIINSKFLLKGSVAEPVLCVLMVGNDAEVNSTRPAEIFVENTSFSVKGSKTAPGIVKVEGSSSHKDFEDFLKDFLPAAQQLNMSANSVNTSMPGAGRDSLMKIYLDNQNKLQTVLDKLVETKPNSYVTPFMIAATLGFAPDDVTKLEARYAKLSSTMKQSIAAKNLMNIIAEKRVGAVGSMAMDFTQPDTTGTPVSLSSFKGKYVLLDFWASWCKPCRLENPTVVENYNNFKSKNFTVLGVSLDRPGQKQIWIDAIKEDNLTWTHVSDLQYWQSAVAQLYKVTGIPQNFLIDPSGKIIAKNLRGEALRSKLCEVLGCN